MKFNRKTILIVDDDKMFVLYLGIMLRRMGFNVLPADGGAELLKILKLTTPDLVMMDVYMPGIDGVETLSQIRKDPKTCGVPIIMISSDKNNAVRCEEAGCNAFLSKPIPMDDLHDLLQEFIFSSDGFKRKHMRANARLNVMLEYGGSMREALTETVSEGGIYIKTDEPLSVGTELFVLLPCEDGDLKLEGTVIYIKGAFDNKGSFPKGMAVEFRNLGATGTRKLKELVKELITSDINKNSGLGIVTKVARPKKQSPPGTAPD